MTQVTNDSLLFPSSDGQFTADPLTEVIRQGARRLLMQAVEAEVAVWINERAHLIDKQGHRQVVRNGYAEPRTIVTGVGPVEVTMPRVHDRRPQGEREPFTSKILPPYLRKAKSVEELIPWLYLKGISTGDFNEALAALRGPNCPGLSASTVTRLKAIWEAEYKQWNERDLNDKRYVYVWADGVHFNVRLEEDRTCILVLMGATEDGRKELIGIADGYRESEQSWKSLLLDVKQRGLTVDPHLATGDGALGFWKALPQVYPKTRPQRCWVHKTVNVLDKLPKRLHGEAKDRLHQIWMAPTREDAEVAFDHFVATYEAKYPKAVACLSKDRKQLLTFYDFPAAHWIHLRTTNPIESMFATVRLRTAKTKGCGSRVATLTMVFKLAMSAQQRFRKLNGHELIGDVIAGIQFINGEKKRAA
ncbi:MAG: IS256 family transposase [bacterium]|nr:IS256 family transposase [bacterium]